jgi:hypothetical protein
MSKSLAAATAILLSLGAPASAHRLDEYLQATIISVEKDSVQACMRLIPGVAVSSIVISNIDTNGDGIISDTEQQDYAERVVRDLSLSVDGFPVKPRLVSADFPRPEEMKEGLGEIQIEFSADLPRSKSSKHRLIFENHHQSRIAAYLVNCLVPRDKNIQITEQNRNESQSLYQLNYIQADGRPDPLPLRWWSRVRASVGNLGGFPSMFRLGMRHIAEGTDHLLFLLALLSAPTTKC